MSRKKILTILLIVILIGIALIVWWKFNNKSEQNVVSEDTTISTIEAVPGSVSIKVEGPSIIEPYQTRTIRSFLDGIITMTVAEGDPVEEGEILISLDGSDMRIAVEQAKINLSKAELNRNRNRTTLKNEEKSLQDTTQLFNSGAVSGDQVNKAKLAVDTALFNLNSSNLDVSQAALILDIARKNLDNIHIKAPYSGIVLSTSVIPGDMISQGTALLLFVDLSKVRLKAEVDEFDIGKVQKGQKVTITSDSLGDEKLGSKVERVSPGAEVINNISIFTVSTVLNNEEGKLKPGMSADLSILISADKGLLVPSKAVTSIRTRSYVKVYTGEEVETRKVTVGADDGRNIVVLEGLNEGDLVIIPSVPGFQLPTTSSSSSGTSVIPVQIPGSGSR
ncbi:MAG: efflux RND transporter periplasmic adaptor subunit [Spirochaetia bacterium]|jgi:HlyD family secretion protein|nr:efflux RND transporter periplasmic adaptor subunit [Spirochaetia bacterium]